MRVCLVYVFFFCGMGHSFAQAGGNNTFEFLNLVSAARVASVGGTYVAVANDNDLNLVFQNPSLLNGRMHNHLAFNYINYFMDIGYGSFLYARDFKNTGTFSAGLRYIDYGEFVETNEQAEVLGSFAASEYAFHTAWARPVDSMFTIGAGLKFIYSEMEQYYANGLAADLGVTWHNDKQRLAIAAVIKNMGMQFKQYVPGSKEPLPFEIQMGLSKKLKHMPFRYVINLTNLQQWDLTYENSNNPAPTVDPLTGEVIEPKKKTGDKIMRHIVVGGEFVPSENFSVRFGYNYKRRQELKLDTKYGMVGFSWGFGLRISKFHVSYGRASYHLAGASNHFSLTTNLSEFASGKAE